MAEMTEEEKYRRKQIMLDRALAAADEKDAEDAKKDASRKAKAKAARKAKRDTENESAKKQAEEDGSPVLG